jgi:hypothetical protein
MCTRWAAVPATFERLGVVTGVDKCMLWTPRVGDHPGALALAEDRDALALVRRRLPVATRGHRTDAFPGLGLKAHLVRERTAGSPVLNQYAPFYLWHDVGGMSRFLVGGGGFQGIVEISAAPVAHWTGIALEPGPARAAPSRSASREVTPLGEETGLAGAIEDLRKQAKRGGVHTAALAFDPFQWQLLRFVLWGDEAPGRYEVLHLSSPHLSEIPAGRHW